MPGPRKNCIDHWQESQRNRDVHSEGLRRTDSVRWEGWTRKDTARSKAPIQNGSIATSDQSHSPWSIRTSVFSVVEERSGSAVADCDRIVRRSTSGRLVVESDARGVRGKYGSPAIVLYEVETEVGGGPERCSYHRRSHDTSRGMEQIINRAVFSSSHHLSEDNW